MNNSELKKIINKTISGNKHFGFIHFKNLIIREPIKEILQGFCFEKSPHDKNGFYLWVFVQPIFIENDNIVLTFGKRIKNKNGNEWWSINKENENYIIQNLNTVFENEGFNYLNQTGSLNKFFNYFRDCQTNLRIMEAVSFTSFIIGNKDCYKENDTLINEIEENHDLGIKWKRDILDKLYLIKNINDDSKLKQIFLGWSYYTVKQLGLSNFIDMKSLVFS
ncbi:MAG: hypothetical protein JW870_21555 [Candidatus Delongbacteria bacterium]|nr:hypothetical protein [Candidatus Delongbacteria bacterium]